LKFLGRKEEPLTGETSQPHKIRKKSSTEEMAVLLASVEKHGRPRPKPTSEVVSVPLDPTCPKQIVQISEELDPMIRDGIVELLEQHRDVFAFDPSEMQSIAPDVMEHKLCVDLNHRSVIQKWRPSERGNPREAYTQLGRAIYDHLRSTTWNVSSLNPLRGKDTKDMVL